MINFKNIMTIDIVLVNNDQKDLLNQMIKAYQKELLGLKNPKEYKYLDSYFGKATHKPYFIKVKKEITGFALVNKYSVVEKGCYSIAEFYVVKEYRNKHIGKTAAIKIFDLSPGKWEIRELKTSTGAQQFWSKVLNDYTKNNFKEVYLENEHWTGPVQIFNNFNIKSHL